LKIAIIRTSEALKMHHKTFSGRTPPESGSTGRPLVGLRSRTRTAGTGRGKGIGRRLMMWGGMWVQEGEGWRWEKSWRVGED